MVKYEKPFGLRRIEKIEHTIPEFATSKIPEIKQYLDSCQTDISKLEGQLFYKLPSIEPYLQKLETDWTNLDILIDLSKLPNSIHSNEVSVEIKNLRNLLESYKGKKNYLKIAGGCLVTTYGFFGILIGSSGGDLTQPILFGSVLGPAIAALGATIYSVYLGAFHRPRISRRHVEPIRNLFQHFKAFEKNINPYLAKYE